jgi:hypothetical protein
MPTENRILFTFWAESDLVAYGYEPVSTVDRSPVKVL